ncbi:hypothetical protein [Massilibacteroides vaginae]|uniref:hypothetical protein n=1 Tax=Massilibacteroides vaginae TaxID=1673718 RepID=UPI000A1CA599|nr:hypothetical protein [Massilibacteroides vaginae]
MAVTKIRKVSSLVFIVSILISVVVFGFYYGGGIVDPTAETPEPVNTDILLYWLYILLGIVIGMTVFFAVLQIGKLLKSDPKSGMLSIGAIVLMAGLLLITRAMGSDVPLPIPGYEGTENVPFWLKTTDMFLYSIYAMVVLIVVVIVWGNVRKALTK